MKKRIKPDHIEQIGPYTIAQKGNFVFMRSNLNAADIQQIKVQAAQNKPALIKEINEKIAELVVLIHQYDCLKLLKMGIEIWAFKTMGLHSESQHSSESINTLHAVQYIQSIIASSTPTANSKIDDFPSQSTWERIVALVSDIYRLSTLPYCYALGAEQELSGESTVNNELFAQAVNYRTNVCGNQHDYFESSFFEKLLSPHEEWIQKCWGVSLGQLLLGLQQIKDSLMKDLPRAFFRQREIDQVLKNLSQDQIEKIYPELEGPIESPEDFWNALFDYFGWADEQEELKGKIQQYDIFDLEVATDLPISFLEDFSWSQGECNTFFDSTEYSAWPTRLHPTQTKPFLKIDGRFYCFDLYRFTDHFYRIIQRKVWEKHPEAKENWLKKQTEFSESYPIDLFLDLLPGATIYKGAYYGEKGLRKETDAVIIFEDILFIVEIKSKSFIGDPPSMDFEGYQKSLQELVFHPLEQGSRLADYLEQQGEVYLFSGNSKKSSMIASLQKNDFRRVIIVGINLDHIDNIKFPEQLGAKTMPPNFSWLITLSDLLMAKELFPNPFVFCHFLLQRERAYRAKNVEINNETDYYGAYFLVNNFSYLAEQSTGGHSLSFLGYSENIDKYFNNLTHFPDQAVRPKQDIPTLWETAVNLVSQACGLDRLRVIEILLDVDGKDQKNLVSQISQMLIVQAQDQRQRALNSYGVDNVSFFCTQEGVELRNEIDIRSYCLAKMIKPKQEERLALIFHFDAEGALFSINWRLWKHSEIQPNEFDSLQKENAHQLESQFASVLTGKKKKKLSRNEKCPCGSGNKYKRCCGKLG